MFEYIDFSSRDLHNLKVGSSLVIASNSKKSIFNKPIEFIVVKKEDITVPNSANQYEQEPAVKLTNPEGMELIIEESLMFPMSNDWFLYKNMQQWLKKEKEQAKAAIELINIKKEYIRQFKETYAELVKNQPEKLI